MAAFAAFARLAGLCGQCPKPVQSPPRGMESAIPGSRVLLCFQEQIKDPENAPAARFYGLCCYQTRSEKKQQIPGQGGYWAATKTAPQTPGVAFKEERLQKKANASESGPAMTVIRPRGATAPRFASKTGANRRLQKRLHRTVLRALLLSNKERNWRWISGQGVFRAGRLQKRHQARLGQALTRLRGWRACVRAL